MESISEKHKQVRTQGGNRKTFMFGILRKSSKIVFRTLDIITFCNTKGIFPANIHNRDLENNFIYYVNIQNFARCEDRTLDLQISDQIMRLTRYLLS